MSAKSQAEPRSSCERVGQAQRTHHLQDLRDKAHPPPLGLATAGPNALKNDGSWGRQRQRWIYQWAHNLKEDVHEHLRDLCGITWSAP